MFTFTQFEKAPGIFKRKRNKVKIRVTDEEMAANLGISVAELHQRIDHPDQFTAADQSKVLSISGIDVVEFLREAKLLEKTAESTLEEGEVGVESAMDRLDAALDRFDEAMDLVDG